MRPLNAMARHRALPRDPAPSKWKYRYQRMMLTPGFRGLIRVGVPLALITIIGVSWYSHADNRAKTTAKWEQIKHDVQQRPEFMVSSMDVSGVDDALRDLVLAQLPTKFPVSSFDLDLEAMRVTVEGLDAVRSARVRVGDAGVLDVDITPRAPVAIWRDGDVLRLLDEDGTFAGYVTSRSDRLDLPLIAGKNAQENMDEALAIFREARPIADRLRGLARMGARRWDVVLDRDQRIMLPAQDPLAALARVIVLHQARDMLDRDVAVVDMRNGSRPTVRMNKEAANAFRQVSQKKVDD